MPTELAEITARRQAEATGPVWVGQTIAIEVDSAGIPDEHVDAVDEYLSG